MELRWNSYHYFPYERDLAIREIYNLLSPNTLCNTQHGIRLEGCSNIEIAERLVYFAEVSNGEESFPTIQSKLERVNGNGLNRQSTRYSVHGIHEYKGKFNPQIVRAVLNILKVPLSARVIDPFCGSGTSLVECSHLGMEAVGIDINPLAVFIANSKLTALQLPSSVFRKEADAVIKRYKSAKLVGIDTCNARIKYLQNWFEPIILEQIEMLRTSIKIGHSACIAPLLCIASNLLREYSLQDPHDLRIRRRKSSLPEIHFIDAFEVATNLFLSRLESVQSVLEKKPALSKALLLDSRSINMGNSELGKNKFDCALTSPPYATALPYIDTQRLSLVWLELLQPSEILRLEAQLIGSREVRGESKRQLLIDLKENRCGLPKQQVDYCCMLQSALSEEDGFRRQAVPLLLYRYFVGMAEVFKSMQLCVKNGAPFALVVGSNHTVLGKVRFDINTPQHLAEIAQSCGWVHEETVPLQTYQRYGYHMSNAVSSEGLVIVRSK